MLHRQIYTPELDPLKFPPVVALKSVNNIPIENLWKWLRQMFGRSLREWIEDGKTNGIFNSTSEIHMYVLVPPSCECRLMAFKSSLPLAMVSDCPKRLGFIQRLLELPQIAKQSQEGSSIWRGSPRNLSAPRGVWTGSVRCSCRTRGRRGTSREPGLFSS